MDAKEPGQLLDESMFNVDKSTPSGLNTKCKDCNSKKWEKYSAKPDTASKRRNTDFIRKYGITLEQRNNILIKQNHKCAICGIDEIHSKGVHGLVVDHDHKTGVVRRPALRPMQQRITANFRTIKKI